MSEPVASPRPGLSRMLGTPHLSIRPPDRIMPPRPLLRREGRSFLYPLPLDADGRKEAAGP
jgi:hypothetical protein